MTKGTGMADGKTSEKWLLVDLPIMDYAEARGLQQDLLAAKAEKRIDDNVVLCLEHPRVYTIGRRGGRENLKVADEFLGREGIPVIDVERGGDITYHGPGQLVVYPIVHLEEAGLGIGEFITSLEEVMLCAASALGVSAERNSLNRGIWIGDNKLGNIGICVRRGIAFHGLSLNVNVALEPFDWINPCGLQGIAVTSIERELSRKIAMGRAREAMKQSVEKVFGVNLTRIGLPELRRRIELKKNASL
jgi:lipoate-protein ligase B